MVVPRTLTIWLAGTLLLSGCTSPSIEAEGQPVAPSAQETVIAAAGDASTVGGVCIWVDSCRGVLFLPPVRMVTIAIPENTTLARFTIQWEPVGPTTERLELTVWRSGDMTQTMAGASPLEFNLADVSAGTVDFIMDSERVAGAAHANDVQPWHLEGELHVVE